MLKYGSSLSDGKYGSTLICTWFLYQVNVQSGPSTLHSKSTVSFSNTSFQGVSRLRDGLGGSENMQRRKILQILTGIWNITQLKWSAKSRRKKQKGWVHYLNLQFHRYRYYRHAHKGSYTVRRCEWSDQTEVQFDQADGKVMTKLNLPETFRVVFSLSSVLNEPLLALQWYSPLFGWSIEAMVKLSLLAGGIFAPLKYHRYSHPEDTSTVQLKVIDSLGNISG